MTNIRMGHTLWFIQNFSSCKHPMLHASHSRVHTPSSHWRGEPWEEFPLPGKGTLQRNLAGEGPETGIAPRGGSEQQDKHSPRCQGPGRRSHLQERRERSLHGLHTSQQEVHEGDHTHEDCVASIHSPQQEGG